MNHNCNKLAIIFERELSHTEREKMSRNSYRLIKESRLFIEDARIFYAKRQGR